MRVNQNCDVVVVLGWVVKPWVDAIAGRKDCVSDFAGAKSFEVMRSKSEVGAGTLENTTCTGQRARVRQQGSAIPGVTVTSRDQ